MRLPGGGILFLLRQKKYPKKGDPASLSSCALQLSGGVSIRHPWLNSTQSNFLLL